MSANTRAFVSEIISSIRAHTRLEEIKERHSGGDGSGGGDGGETTRSMVIAACDHSISPFVNNEGVRTQASDLGQLSVDS